MEDDRRPTGARRSRLEARRTGRDQRYGRFLGLTALGSLVPGAGLFAAGKRRLATFLIVTLTIVAIAALAVVAFVPLGKLASYAGDTRVLPIIGGALILAAAVWVTVALVTHRSLEPEGLPTSKRLTGALVVVLTCSLVVAPLAVAAQNVFTQRDLIGAISGGGNSHTTPEIEDVSDPWANKPRLNVLLLGGDGGEGRTGVRPDTQIMASIDTHTGETTIISLPRNLQKVPFPEDSPLTSLYPDGYQGPGDVGEWLLNSVYRNVPDAHPEVFAGIDNPGADANKWAVEGALGVDVDYYLLVNLDGFEAVVNALGGITVDVPRRIPWGNKDNGDGTCTKANGYIEPGEDQHLDGFHALWFARSRCGSDDYDRMARQRCVMNAIVAKADPATLLTQYQSLATATKDIVFTDIPENLFPPLIELMLKVKSAGLESLTLDDDFFASMGTTSADPDYAQVHQRVAEALAGTPDTAETPPTDTTGGDAGDDTTEAASEGAAQTPDTPAASAGVPAADQAEQPEGTDEPESTTTTEPPANPDDPVDTGTVC